MAPIAHSFFWLWAISNLGIDGSMTSMASHTRGGGFRETGAAPTRMCTRTRLSARMPAYICAWLSWRRDVGGGDAAGLLVTIDAQTL